MSVYPEKCYLLRFVNNPLNHKLGTEGFEMICRDPKTLSRLVNEQNGIKKVTPKNVFSWEMRTKYKYQIYEYLYFE
jgi:hypothetical protein